MSSSAIDAPAPIRERHDLAAQRERLFFSGMAVACLLTVLAGFSRSYYFNAWSESPFQLSPLLHWHGIVFTAWMLLLVTQTSLVAANRRDLTTHKRLMLLATLEVVTAAVARLPIVDSWGPLGFFGVTNLFVVAMVVYDLLSRKREHAATLWGGLFLVASQPLRLMIGGSETWLAFAAWLTS